MAKTKQPKQLKLISDFYKEDVMQYSLKQRADLLEMIKQGVKGEALQIKEEGLQAAQLLEKIDHTTHHS